MAKFSIRFLSGRDGNEGIVKEEVTTADGEVHHSTFRMPAARVPGFITARRALWFLRARRAGASPVAEISDFDYLRPKQ